ncbi:MAG: sulfatase-like hydrolase/transferase, partial [Planctomycetaceae bacterium]
IVVYFCDNGPNGVRWNGDMKGRKGSTNEGGVRSPMLIRWPGKIPAGRVVKQIGGAIDLLPTLADLAGVPVVSKKKLDGISLREQIVGSDEITERLIFSHWRGKVSVRNQHYRLGTEGQLFDLRTDPGQRTNIATKDEKHRALHLELSQAADTFRSEIMPSDFGKNDNRTFPLGSPDFRYTQIPARDATAHGGLKRSNRYPNCSYFTNWTKTDDKLTWDVEVMHAGKYEVEMYYTCPPSDVGSTVELSCGDSSVVAKITVAHDPPERGAADDRYERVESYVKDFRPMSLGTIELKPGKQTLTLQATDIRGKSAFEFRLLMFTRKSKF